MNQLELFPVAPRAYPHSLHSTAPDTIHVTLKLNVLKKEAERACKDTRTEARIAMAHLMQEAGEVMRELIEQWVKDASPYGPSDEIQEAVPAPKVAAIDYTPATSTPLPTYDECLSCQ